MGEADLEGAVHPQTLPELVSRLAEWGDEKAVAAFEKEDIRWVMYDELRANAARFANRLRACGIEANDTVGIAANPSPEWIAGCLGIAAAGAVVVPIDTQFSTDVLRHVVEDSGVRYVVTDARNRERLEQDLPESAVELLVFDASEDDPAFWLHGTEQGESDIPEVAEDARAILFYTSGTTGMPKGVPLTHRNILFQAQTLAKARLVSPGARVLLPMPLHHVYPLVVGVITSLSLGLCIVFPHLLTGPQLVRSLREAEVTHVIGVPRLYEALLSGIRSRMGERSRLLAGAFGLALALSRWCRRRLRLRVGRMLFRPLRRAVAPHLQITASGGAPLDPELAWNLEALGWQVAVGYGLTETSPLLTIDPPGNARIGSVGRPVEGVDVRVDSEDGEGEIQARGPNVFGGYHDLQEETDKAFTEDGWFRTGDLGYFDGDGYLYVTGRKSTRIVTPGGENVEPDDVERAYERSPFIREAGVLQHDGDLVAVIVPDTKAIRESGETEIERAIRTAVSEQSRRLPSYQRIGNYQISTEALARTRLGKIQRHSLKERYEQAKEGSGAAAQAGPIAVEEMSDQDRELLDAEPAWKLWQWLGTRYADQRLTPDTSLSLDLGVDSLEWLELTLAIQEKTGLEIEEEAIGRIETVRDLLREVVEAERSGEKAFSPTEIFENPERFITQTQRRWLEPHTQVSLIAGHMLFVLFRLIMRGAFRLDAHGLEHLPEKGPLLIAPNHTSYLDPFAVGMALGLERLRNTYWGGWTGVVFANPLMRAFSRLAQVVPIDKERAVLSSLAFGAAVLKRDQSLVWYPEGQRSASGELLRFRPGIGLLAHHLDVPIVPVYIHGAHEALPRGSRWVRFRPITVTFGEPVAADTLEREGSGEEPQDRIADALFERVGRLGEEKTSSTASAA